MHRWSREELDYLKEHYPNRTQKELLKLFNDWFGLSIGPGQLQSVIKRYKIKGGRRGTFKKGRTPWNKGLKGIGGGGFEKGCAPPNERPIGSELVNVEGYVVVKVSEPSKWVLKHRLLWEEENGPIPKGYVVIFGDGDKTNLNIDNLILVSRAQLAVMNKFGLIQNNAELTRTGAILADLHMKINERKND